MENPPPADERKQRLARPGGIPGRSRCGRRVAPPPGKSEGGFAETLKLDQERLRNTFVSYILRGEEMSKMEKEYFSRVVKKKLKAMADPDLQRLAQKALQ